MTRKDCVYYHCEHQMGASIDCCTLRKELGDCPCTLNCEKYANKTYVYKLGLNELRRMNNGEEMGNGVIYRQDAIDALGAEPEVWINDDDYAMGANNQWHYDVNALKAVPSAEPEKEKAKRVLWTGWKGYRDTRYKCPNCKKPVKNDDVYCHRCGQRLMFPHISFTDYIPGEKQETIVRWDDE